MSRPPFVGVALRHNERVAWGLTIAGNDQSDVFVEEVNPANPNEVKHNGVWEPLKIVRDEIEVKGEAPRAVEFKIGRHGPILRSRIPRSCSTIRTRCARHSIRMCSRAQQLTRTALRHAQGVTATRAHENHQGAW